MGYDVKRFQGSVDEEFICAICKCVYQNPYQILPCEHTFCLTCIQTWFVRDKSCPIDRQKITAEQISVAPRIVRNLLSRLQIKCDFEKYGCKTVVKLEFLPTHLMNCSFDPKKSVLCHKECGARVPEDKNTGYNCVRDLRIKVESLEAKAKELLAILETRSLVLSNLRRELQALKLPSFSGSTAG